MITGAGNGASQNPAYRPSPAFPSQRVNRQGCGLPGAKMDSILKRIKRCIIQGQVRFTFKAELEMLADQLSRVDVLEAILSAPGISRILKSRRKTAGTAEERLYVILGFTYDGILVYTKGKLQRESGQEVFYILISSKRAVEG
jgi:hypothetical protein